MLKTVSAKLTAATATALLIVVAMAGMNLFTQGQLLRRADSIATAAEAVRQVTTVRAALARARRHEQESIVAASNVNQMELRAASWSAAMQDTRAALQALRANVASAGSEAALASADEQLQRYAAGFAETLDAVKKGMVSDPSTADNTMEDARRQVESADGLIAQLAQSLVQRADAARSEMAATARGAHTASLALLGGFAVIGVAGSVLMRRAIMRPLGQAVAIARRVAAGDLASEAMPPRRDEFGQLLDALGEMRAQLHGLVAGVHQSVDSVARSAHGIASASVELSARTESQVTSLRDAAGAVQRISDAIHGSAEGVEAASTSARGMFAAARVDGERVGQVVDTMQRISETTRRIQQITGLIDGIALQTHILGLNAAVEASNAGVHGRGFAVVAASVRELAERCRDAAVDVRRLIGEAGAQADAGAQLAQQAGAGIVALVASAQSVSENIGAIEQAAQEQRNAIEAVSASLAQAGSATQNNAALVQETAAAAQGLKQQADRLAGSVSAFKLA